MKIMILGARGYLGRKLTTYFREQGVKVVQVVREDDASKGVDTINCDNIYDELQSEQYDWVVNCVAVYEKNSIDRMAIIQANLIFALQVLEWVAITKTANFLTIDTSLPEELNLYSFSKKKFAEFGRFYSENYGLNFVNVILEMFYGADEPEDRFFHKCYKDMVLGGELLLTEGKQKRDIIHISDVCKGIEKIIYNKWNGYVNVPLGTGEAVSVREMLEYMHDILKSTSTLNFGALPLRKHEPNCISDISILKEKGFRPEYTWRKGILYLCNSLGKENQNE